jgi:hypothetical protein
MYLMADGNNPTRHDIVMPGYTEDAELHRLIELLEQQKVGLVLLTNLLIREGDPVAAYVHAHYDCDADGVCVRRG